MLKKSVMLCYQSHCYLFMNRCILHCRVLLHLPTTFFRRMSLSFTRDHVSHASTKCLFNLYMNAPSVVQRINYNAVQCTVEYNGIIYDLQCFDAVGSATGGT